LPGRDIHLILATSTGGVGRHVRALAGGLNAKGVQVTVHGPSATEEMFGFTAAGATFVPTEIASGFALGAAAVAARSLHRTLRGADLVHAHGLRAGLVASMAVSRGTPLIVTWHNTVLDDAPLRRLQSVLERRVARAATVTLTVSADLADRVRELGGRDVRVAPVGVNPLPAPTRDVLAVRRELDAVDRSIVLVVGRLHRQKGIDVLIRAATAWSARDVRPLIVVAGDGPERDALSDLAHSLGVPLRLLGHRTDISDLLAAADVVVLPSRWEGSPLAAHEALHAGRPLVATEVGGMSDLLAEGGAILVPPEDPVTLAHRVGQLLDLPGKAVLVGNAGLLAAARWPDETHSVAAVIDVYRDVLTRARQVGASIRS
jgi:glycosyltransferase involved in cell wall biosynthesis